MAEQSATVVPPAPPAGSFRTILELAERCGHYCWLESRLFELTGAWASTPTPAGPTTKSDPAIRVLFSEMSARHGFLAMQWRDRLPVRAGVDSSALVVPPSGPAKEALDLLGTQSDLAVVLGGLVEQFLPRLLRAYDEHLAQASPVNEAPVRAVIEVAVLRGLQETQAGRALLQPGPGVAVPGGRVAELCENLERLLGGNAGIFPAAQAS